MFCTAGWGDHFTNHVGVIYIYRSLGILYATQLESPVGWIRMQKSHLSYSSLDRPLLKSEELHHFLNRVTLGRACFVYRPRMPSSTDTD